MSFRWCEGCSSEAIEAREGLLASKRTTLAFYLDRILAFQENAVGSIDYANFSAVSSGIRYVENDSLAADATVVDKTWQYVNKKGGPDRRFKNNRELAGPSRFGVVLIWNLQSEKLSGLLRRSWIRHYWKR